MADIQTFVPYPSFEESARALDDKRLGKQRIETFQILTALLTPSVLVTTAEEFYPVFVQSDENEWRWENESYLVDLPKHQWYYKKVGWTNHPATIMWRGYEWSLLQYQYAICTEWHVVRGFRDSCFEKSYRLFWETSSYLYEDAIDYPWWWGDPEVHRSHRSNLLRKKPEHYGQIFEKGLPDDLPYIWPNEEPDSNPTQQ